MVLFGTVFLPGVLHFLQVNLIIVHILHELLITHVAPFRPEHRVVERRLNPLNLYEVTPLHQLFLLANLLRILLPKHLPYFPTLSQVSHMLSLALYLCYFRPFLVVYFPLLLLQPNQSPCLKYESLSVYCQAHCVLHSHLKICDRFELKWVFQGQ